MRAGAGAGFLDPLHLAARAAEAAAGFAPEALARATGGTLGVLAWRPLGLRRELVLRQVAAAFPERPPAWVRSTARACYRHYGRELAALPRLRRNGVEVLLERTAGLDRVRRLMREHGVPRRGAVVVTGHVGNWELAGAVLAGLGIPVSAAYRPPRSPALAAWIEEIRRGLGVEPVREGRAPFRLPRALASGRVVALVADQHAGSRGAVVSFLGRRASTWRGPVRLAVACGVPLFFGALLREGSGYRALVEPVDTADAPGGDEELTRRWVARLEATVRRAPAQYFWFHRRWKAAGEGAGTRSTGSGRNPVPGGDERRRAR